jgi:hypothetical protein
MRAGSANAVGEEEHLRVAPMDARVRIRAPMATWRRGCGDRRRHTAGFRPAALAQTAGSSNSAQAQVASPSASPMSNADKRIAADLLFKRLLIKPDDLDAGFRFSRLLDRFWAALFVRGARLRAYRLALDDHAFGRLLVHPVCGTGPDCDSLHHTHRQAMAGGGDLGRGVLPESRLHPASPVSSHLFDHPELQPV